MENEETKETINLSEKVERDKRYAAAIVENAKLKAINEEIKSKNDALTAENERLRAENAELHKNLKSSKETLEIISNFAKQIKDNGDNNKQSR